MKGIRAKPKPFGGTRPVIMNAGASPTGRSFAIRNCDAFFTNPSRISVEETRDIVQAAKRDAAAFGRELDVYSVGVVTCRPTQKEADDYYRHTVVEHADWAAVDEILAMKNIRSDQMSADEFQVRRLQQANGMGGLPLVGDPDRVASLMNDLATAGLSGVAVSLVNYVDELPYFCAEVLPRLERLGWRQRH
jgi:dimethylsulfone monooxygenase